MDTLTQYQGKVRNFKPVTKNRVQIELDSIQGVFELFIDQSWVLSSGDNVKLIGTRDETGKYCCYSYANISKNVKGWKHPVNNLQFYFAIAFTLLFFIIGLEKQFTPFMFTPILTIMVILSLKTNMQKNKILEHSLSLINNNLKNN